MFRFTIRDVLWLMVVIGLALGLAVSFRNQIALLEAFDDLKQVSEAQGRDHRSERDAFTAELQRVTGKPVTVNSRPGPYYPWGKVYTFDYDDEPTPKP